MLEDSIKCHLVLLVVECLTRQLPLRPTRYCLYRKHPEVVSMKPFIVLTATVTAIALTEPALAWGGGECKVKREAKYDEFKEEVKCR